MAVIRSIKVDIPKSHITIERQSGGRPALIKYVLEAPYNREKGYPEPKRTTIGHQCPDDRTKMYPTTQYAAVFPDAWEKVSGEKAKPVVKRIGMFTLCQAVNMRTGLKDTMDGVFGVDVSDAVMDFAMYSILHKSDVVSAFQAGMRGEMLYSGDARSDSGYARLFEHRMPREQMLQFRKEWAFRCKEEGFNSVWLCIDGSNDDCRSKGVEIAEKGAAKSKKNVNIISFTYAVTEEGFPVTFDVYEGGMVDAKAMKGILSFLTEAGILLRGVILDRGYCTKPTLEYLNGAGIPYVIMVKGQPEGFASIVGEYGNQIKMNAEYLVPGTYLFGVQKEVQLFKSYSHEDYVTLFFDYQNGSERVTALLKNLYGAMDDVSSRLTQKNNEVEVEEQFQGMLRIETKTSGDGQEQRQVKIDASGLQKAIDEKGLYSIVSSEKMPPEEVYRRYASRDASETQYRFIKTQLGYGTLRVQDTQAVYAKFLTAFIASIIRFEIEQASKALGQSATRMIDEADRLEMVRLDNVYTYTHTEKARITDLFSKLGADGGMLLDETTKAENDRVAGRIPVLRHRKTGPKRGSHRKQHDPDGNVVRRKSGVEPGTKRPAVNQDGSARKRPGVAPGTKRGIYNKDGSLRKKPGPKSHNEVTAG